VLPYGPNLGIYHDDYTASQGWFAPATTIVAVAAWITTATAAWHLRRRIPGFALGIGIFLVGHALESTIFPLLLYFEHRNYLPSIGLIWALLCMLSFSIDALGQSLPHLEKIASALGLAAIAILAATTAAQASVWGSRQTILQQAVTEHPDSRWLRQDLIAEAMDRHPPDLAAVRIHADRLMASIEPSTRRLGAIERLLADCNAGLTADPALLNRIFDGRPEPLEADLVATFELLSDRLRKHPCTGLVTLEVATRLAALTDRATTTSTNVNTLRFLSATLYAAIDRPAQALTQARLANRPSVTDVRIPILVADLLSKSGETAEANRVLNEATLTFHTGGAARALALARNRNRNSAATPDNRTNPP